MRSVLKNKKAAVEMGFAEIMYLILGALIIFFIVTSLFGVDWAAIAKGWLPTFNTTQNNDYSLINGTDEKMNVPNAANIVNKELATTQKGIAYSRLAADVCSYIGFGGTFAGLFGTAGNANNMYRSAYSDQDYSQSGMGEIESIGLVAGTSAAVVDASTGAIIGSIISDGGKITYTASGATMPVTITKTGQVVLTNLGRTVGVVSKDASLQILLKGSSTPIITTTGKEATIVLGKGGAPYLASGKALSFLSKTASVAGYVTSGASAICDLSGIFMSAYSAETAALQFIDAQKASDAQLKNNVDDIFSRTKVLADKTSSLYNNNPELRELSPELLEEVQLLAKKSRFLQERYQEYLSNSDSMSAPFWRKLLFMKASPITNDEYSYLMDLVKDYRAQYVKVQEIYQRDFFDSPYVDENTASETKTGTMIITS